MFSLNICAQLQSKLRLLVEKNAKEIAVAVTAADVPCLTCYNLKIENTLISLRQDESLLCF